MQALCWQGLSSSSKPWSPFGFLESLKQCYQTHWVCNWFFGWLSQQSKNGFCGLSGAWWAPFFLLGIFAASHVGTHIWRWRYISGILMWNAISIVCSWQWKCLEINLWPDVIISYVPLITRTPVSPYWCSTLVSPPGWPAHSAHTPVRCHKIVGNMVYRPYRQYEVFCYFA